MFRAVVLLLLLLGPVAQPLGWSVALSQGENRGRGKDDDKKEEERNRGNERDPTDRPSSDRERRSYYAQVTVNDGRQVFCGPTRLVSDSPWLRLAAPGMWLEANGRWDGQIFRADEVRIVSPKSWAFYQGPAAPLGLVQYQGVETWLQDDARNRFISLKSAPDLKNQVRLVVYFDGQRLQALPPGFPVPIPTGFKAGWLEMTGEWNGRTVVWRSLEAFP